MYWGHGEGYLWLKHVVRAQYLKAEMQLKTFSRTGISKSCWKRRQASIFNCRMPATDRHSKFARFFVLIPASFTLGTVFTGHTHSYQSAILPLWSFSLSQQRPIITDQRLLYTA
eukprot:s7204_g3.t1